jgi:hypothetical protein
MKVELRVQMPTTTKKQTANKQQSSVNERLKLLASVLYSKQFSLMHVPIKLFTGKFNCESLSWDQQGSNNIVKSEKVIP